MAVERIGLFGGSFDPIHIGHLISARCIAEQKELSRVLFIPAARPPHKQSAVLAPAEHRLEMVRLATTGEPLFDVSDVELTRDGPSYSLTTVQQLQTKFGPDAELCWIIGADSLPELVTWYRVEELAQSARILTAARPGWEAPDLTTLTAKLGIATVTRILADVCRTPRIEISATDIRQRSTQRRSIRYLVPDAVEVYIRTHALYSPNYP